MLGKKWIKTPKGNVTIAMVAYLILASIGSKTMMGIENGLIAVAVSLAVDYLYCSMTNRKGTRDGTVITGLIISLILSFTSSWMIVAGTAVMAILSKHLLVYKKKPIFNPAAVGLLLSIFIFHSEQSWWGAFGDLSPLTMIFLLIGGYVVTERVNKFPQVFSFLGTFFVLLFLFGQVNMSAASDAFRSPFINAALFFGFFMLTDPPTSPAKHKDQVIFGFLTALSGVIVYAIFGGLTYLFIGLFVGNLYSNRIKAMKAVTQRQNVKTPNRVFSK